MPTYDAEHFDPPAPVAHVMLRNPKTGARWSDFSMLIDSGADVTLLPQAAVDHLEISVTQDKHYELIGFDGTVSISPAVHLELIFLDRTFRGQFLLIDQEWGILGRNILNAVPVLLNGPQLTWDEQHPA